MLFTFTSSLGIGMCIICYWVAFETILNAVCTTAAFDLATYLMGDVFSRYIRWIAINMYGLCFVHIRVDSSSRRLDSTAVLHIAHNSVSIHMFI